MLPAAVASMRATTIVALLTILLFCCGRPGPSAQWDSSPRGDSTPRSYVTSFVRCAKVLVFSNEPGKPRFAGYVDFGSKRVIPLSDGTQTDASGCSYTIENQLLKTEGW